MNKIKKGLGRGLSSLIGETSKSITVNKANISDLVRNKNQPRKKFDEESLRELTSSIKSRGIIQPIIVRNSDGETKYEIIAGERRWVAAQKAGLHEVPIVVVEADNKKALSTLNWKPTRNIEDMCRDGWKWQILNPNGYV